MASPMTACRRERMSDHPHRWGPAWDRAGKAEAIRWAPSSASAPTSPARRRRDQLSAGIVDVGVIATPAEANDRSVLDRPATIRAHRLDLRPGPIDRLGWLHCHEYASASLSIALSPAAPDRRYRRRDFSSPELQPDPAPADRRGRGHSERGPDPAARLRRRSWRSSTLVTMIPAMSTAWRRATGHGR